jgi:hypothetical protein
MRTSTFSMRAVLGAAVLVGCTSTLFGTALGAGSVGSPIVETGSVTQVRGTSAVLNATVDPHGAATTYYFQYGATIAYGKQTTPASIPAGAVKIKISQPVTGLLIGFHYRIVATNTATTIAGVGKDRAYAPKSTSPKFVVDKPEEPTIFGGSYSVTGKLTGAGNTNRRIELQSSPYPFLEAFEDTGVASATNSLGGFSLRAANLSVNTQFRVRTLDPRPLYSSIVTEKVAVKVTLKVRSSGTTGLVRLYGTVTPAQVGARVSFQLRKAIRETKSEKTTKFATQFSTADKRATKSFSRFSSIVRVSTTGRYRAYVQLEKGPLSSGESSTVVLHAAAAVPKQHHSKN